MKSFLAKGFYSHRMRFFLNFEQKASCKKGRKRQTNTEQSLYKAMFKVNRNGLCYITGLQIRGGKRYFSIDFLEFEH